MTAHPLLVVNLRGTQSEMGAQHAALLGELGAFESPIRYYPQMPRRLLLSGTNRTLADRALIGALSTWLSAALHRLDADRPADYRDRTRAFHAGLGDSPSLSRYVGVMDAWQNAVGLLARYGLVPFAQRAASALPPACSTLMAWGAATDDGRLLHARNFDFPGIGVWEQRPEVAFCTPDDGLRYGFTTSKGADVPGVTAFNEAGLTVTAHTRLHRDVGFRGAAVVDIGHEIVRRARSLDDAIAIARERVSASSWALCVSSAVDGAAVALELSARGVEVVRARPGEAFVAATNRYQHPAMQVDEVTPSAAWVQDCEGRLESLRRHGLRGGLAVPDLVRMLGDHTDPEGPGERVACGVLAAAFTVHSIVSDPTRGVVHVSVGDCPTGRGRFAEIPWQWDDVPGSRVIDDSYEVQRTTRYAAGAAGEAHRWFVEATRREQEAEPVDAVEAAIAEAWQRDPEEPSYRFLAGAFELRSGNVPAALVHLRAAVEAERGSFHRGQALLWASRAAAVAGDDVAARRWRHALLQTDDPLLVGHRKAARREQTRPLPLRRLRNTRVGVQLVHAHL